MVVRLDPVTFEILRNRLSAINDEAAATVRVVSGSPVANEAFDYNTALLTPDGEVFIIGTYIAIHAIALDQLVKVILRDYRENPGINDGDMFICNNPYEGAMHQSDVALVAPIFWGDEIICWTGVAIHQIDVGGPTAGQIAVGAKSIYEEAPVMPPLKIVEEGCLRKDIEREYLIRSRVPHLVGLDLRAKIASNNVSSKRIKELIQKYGVETIKSVIQEIIDYTEKRFKAKLKEIHDGKWCHRSYMDYEGDIYRGMLSLTKKGEKLIFDFTGTSPQAPAVVNCTYGGLLAGILISILGCMCYDMPWCPAGVMKAMEVISEQGTFINSSWPAGACKATTSGNWIVNNLCSHCLAEMLSSSSKYRDRVMTIWMGNLGVEELFGKNQRGEPFGATILDAGMAGGGGARIYKDGIDTGGFLSAVSCAISNVEIYEFNYPMLYLYRRQEKDSAGAGKFRGGAGLGVMYIPHDVEEIPSKTMHCFGLEHSESAGLAGGYPGGNNHVAIIRDSNIHKVISKGKIPSSVDEIEGRWEFPPAIGTTYQKKEDVHKSMGTSGAGGYGDPLERVPSLVKKDVINGLVSFEAAKEIYGVIINPGPMEVDVEGTEAQRRALKEDRKKTVTKGVILLGNIRDGYKLMELNEYLQVMMFQANAYISCCCGNVLCEANKNYKEYTLCKESSVTKAGPLVNPYRIGGDRFIFREFFCPGCLRLLTTEIALKGDPILWDIQV